MPARKSLTGFYATTTLIFDHAVTKHKSNLKIEARGVAPMHLNINYSHFSLWWSANEVLFVGGLYGGYP